MPYDRNVELPPEVRNALPSRAQTIWREAFNAALIEYDGDESKAAAVAWQAVKKAGYRKVNNEWRHVMNDAIRSRV